MSTSQSDFDRGMALEALEIGRKNEREIQSHEDLCAERYKNINEKMDGIKGDLSKLEGIFKWAGGALFTLLIAAFGFLINQTVGANQTLRESNRAADIAATRIELLQDALQRERAARPPVEVKP